MTFDQALRLAAIAVGAILLAVAVYVEARFKDAGCLPFIMGIAGVGFMFYGFTGTAVT